ncbi:class I SAM-dependent methyltransferase [Labrys monachus]|uniref:Ubiquinone/menaquinone biosynthesis C-methylase UbiE n=1 Tax=Labrys monachus TaxID=217067 RepID=A0ABU0FA00_9HYPH|nr:class I SAM-dependent methyltransferase [Labrys monachus]MDQ0390959.1 ubiquinone/menaquinone biosynthesis C-methylase UbiE [Labrys monachus]
MNRRPRSSAGGPGAAGADGPRSRLWGGLGRQLQRPTGLAGALVGRLMAVVNREPARLAVEALAIEPGEKVLELGFGSGASLEALLAKAQGGWVAGVDHSAVMLAQAEHRNRAAIAARRLELVRAPFAALPWPESTFDKALLVNVLYFFDGEGRDMAETCRVLRPGGVAAIYVTRRRTMENWPFSGADTHTLYEEEDLCRLLQAAGFDASHIRMRRVELMFGISGIVATARKPDRDG